MQDSVSQRISILRFILIIGILVAHIPPLIDVPIINAPIDESASLFQAVKVFLSRVVFICAVPTLSVISGYLLFLQIERLSYLELVKKKIRTLLIPLILWNLAVLFFLYLAQSYWPNAYGFRLDFNNLDVSGFLRAVTAWNGLPVNPPTYFLRDLFLCCLAAPIIVRLNKISVWLSLLIVFLFYASGYLKMVMLRPDILLMFVVGSILAVRQSDLTRLDTGAFSALMTYLLLCVMVTSFVLFASPDIVRDYFGTIMEWMRLSSPFLIWPAAVLLLKSNYSAYLKGLSNMSFFLFNSHGPILIFLNIVWLSFIVSKPNQTALEQMLFYVLAPVLALLIIRFAFLSLKKYFPWCLSVLTGQRY